MIRTFPGVLALVLCGLAVPLAAQAQTTPPQPSTDTKPADDQALICIRQDPGSGGRLAPQRVCHTKEEWDKLQGKSR